MDNAWIEYLHGWMVYVFLGAAIAYFICFSYYIIMLVSSICMDLFLPLRFKFFWDCNSRPPCLLKNIIKCSTQNENGSSINDTDNAMPCIEYLHGSTSAIEIRFFVCVINCRPLC